jgi:hypothetical protein
MSRELFHNITRGNHAILPIANSIRDSLNRPVEIPDSENHIIILKTKLRVVRRLPLPPLCDMNSEELREALMGSRQRRASDIKTQP